MLIGRAKLDWLTYRISDILAVVCVKCNVPRHDCPAHDCVPGEALGRWTDWVKLPYRPVCPCLR